MTTEKNNNIMGTVYKVCIVISWLFVGFMVVLFFIGQFAFKHDFFDVGVSKALDIEWEYKTDDGQTGTCTVPCKLGTGLGVGVELRSILPTDIEDGMYLIIHAGRSQDIYIDGELRFTHDGSECELPGRIVKSERYPIRLSSSDSGKSIRIVKREKGVINGNVFEMRYGDLYALNRDFIDSNLIKFAMAIVLFLVAIVMCIANLIMNYNYKVYNPGLRYLGYGMLAIATWIITDSYLYQMVFDNAYIDGLLSFMIIPILPIPFIRYMNEVQEHRYEDLCVGAIAALIVDAITVAILHFTDILSYENTMMISNSIALLCALLLLAFIVLDGIRGYIRRYALIALGLTGLVVFAFLELVFINMHARAFNGIWLTIGIFFMLILSMTHSVRELLASEREKRTAIEANIVKTTFLANMSHEIRTPINSIMGMNEMILRENKDPDIAEYAEHIKRSGNLLLSIIGDVLDVTRIESGKLNIVNNPYNTAGFISDVVDIVYEHAAPKGLEVKLDIDEEMPAVLEGDQNHIKQILINLITNAGKYTNEGQISLRAYASDILMKGDQGTCNVIFEVSDTGIGIKEDNIGRLFDSFTRFDEKKNANVQGTGLGLTIVKSLAEAMNGEVSVSSTYGMGSTFRVVIPQRVISVNPIEDSWHLSHDRKDKKTRGPYRAAFVAPEADILAVDDNGSNLMIIKQLLKATKARVDQADTGNEAISLVSRKHYDVILLDHMMPDPDGVAVLNYIKTDPSGLNYKTPVIVLTANAVGGSRAEYINMGFDDYLSKPIDGITLEQILQRYIPKEKMDYSEVEETDTKEVKANDNEAKPKVFGDGEFKKIAKMFGDEDFAYEVIHKVAEDTLKQLDKMKSDLLVDRFDDYAINAHAIKGMMASVYYEPLRQRSMEHEKAAKEGRYDFIKEDFEDYSIKCREFCDKILS